MEDVVVKWLVETWKLDGEEWTNPPGGLWVGTSREEALGYARMVRLDDQVAVTVNRSGWGYLGPVAGQLLAAPDR